MKLERISENQIRCTLTKGDLADRKLRLSELALGSAKANDLFHELMDQAFDELGFDVDGHPLVIEAVPLNQDCIVLFITKVEDPEELDSRFARFADLLGDLSPEAVSSEDGSLPGGEDLREAFKQLTDEILKRLPGEESAEAEDLISEEELSEDEGSVMYNFCRFEDMDEVTSLCKSLPENLRCESALYKDPLSSHYYLLLLDEGDRDDYLTASARAAEYGNALYINRNAYNYVDEHYELIIPVDALNILREL